MHQTQCHKNFCLSQQLGLHNGKARLMSVRYATIKYQIESPFVNEKIRIGRNVPDSGFHRKNCHDGGLYNSTS